MIQASALGVQTREGRILLQEVTFAIPSPRVIGVYGPNGSGKSTLLKALAGRQEGMDVAGTVRFGAHRIEDFDSDAERIRQILYLGSDFNSPFDLKVQELFEMGAEVSGLGPGSERISAVVRSLGISSFLNRTYRKLSDGEKQFLMFARALIQAPKILVLDETFSKLDLDRLLSVTRIIREWLECGMGFFIASHDLNFLSEVSDELILIKNGRVLAQGTPEAVLTEECLSPLFSRVQVQVIQNPRNGKKKILY